MLWLSFLKSGSQTSRADMTHPGSPTKKKAGLNLNLGLNDTHNPSPLLLLKAVKASTQFKWNFTQQEFQSSSSCPPLRSMCACACVCVEYPSDGQVRQSWQPMGILGVNVNSEEQQPQMVNSIIPWKAPESQGSDSWPFRSYYGENIKKQFSGLNKGMLWKV